MNRFRMLSLEEQKETNGGKIIVTSSPSLGAYQLAVKYLFSFVHEFKKGVGDGVADARRDHENGLVY